MSGAAWNTAGRAPDLPEVRGALAHALRRSAPWTCPHFEPAMLPPHFALRGPTAGLARGRRLLRDVGRLVAVGLAAREFVQRDPDEADVGPAVGPSCARRGARWRALRLALAAALRHERTTGAQVDAIDHARQPARYRRAVARWTRRWERLRALRRTLLTHVPLPLCPACRGSIGGAHGGPDAPWRPAVPPERCAAQDHAEHDPRWTARGDSGPPCEFGGCDEPAVGLVGTVAVCDEHAAAHYHPTA